MRFITEYSMPLAAALLLALFFLALPALKTCRLPRTSGAPRSLERADALIMLIITLVYAATAFYKLGDLSAPESFADMGGQSAVVTVPESGVSGIHIYTGVGIGSYEFEYSADGGSYVHLAEFTQSHADVLKWHCIEPDFPVSSGFIRVTGSGGVYLGELVLTDGAQQPLPISCTAPALCDEQALYQDRQTYMNSSYFDEIYHARTAWEHLNGVYPYEITHPPLGKIIISAGIALFGMTPFGWRFSGTLFGVLMLPVMYVFLKKIFGGRSVPAAGTIVFASDFMHFVQTRLATIDTYAVFFILLMYLFMYLFITEERRTYLALAGIFFGLGAASKWTCFYAGAGLAVIWAAWVVTSARAGRLDLRGFIKNAAFCTLFFIIIPVCIYYLSYLPYAAAKGNVPLFSREYLQTVLSNQEYMFNYHSSVDAAHPYSSRWYQWVLDVRPILYYLEYLPDGMRSSFGAFVNPALCWGGLICLFILAYLAAARRDKTAAFILTGYLAQLLPWCFVSRVTFEYHYFACTVFLVLALAYVFDIFRHNSGRWKIPVFGFAAFSTALFALFYPALSGMPVNNHLASVLLGWLPSWPF